MGLSRTCVRTWLSRFATEGISGLEDRSARPHSSPTRTTPDVEAAVIAQRQCTRHGQDRIGAALGLAPCTVGRILRRHHQPCLRDCAPLTGIVIRASRTTAVRYEHATPGALVHMDGKQVACISDGGGWKAHGRGQASRNRRQSVGYDYVHVLVDDHSRFAYAEVLSDAKEVTRAGFLRRAALAFAAAGIPRIERVMTDNAGAYKHSLGVVLSELGATQVFIRPHCPCQNGKVERFNRTLQAEWAYRQVFTSNAERTAAFGPWLKHDTMQRRHSALGRLPPIRGVVPIT